MTGADQESATNTTKIGARMNQSQIRRVERKGKITKKIHGSSVPLDSSLLMGDLLIFEPRTLGTAENNGILSFELGLTALMK